MIELAMSANCSAHKKPLTISISISGREFFGADWHIWLRQIHHLKMINRLVEHDSGVIRFAGEKFARCQYWSCAAGWAMPFNLWPVPPLERGAKHRYRAAITKWSRARIDDRIDELMALLGLSQIYVSVIRISFPVVSSNVWSGARTGCRSASLTDG